MQDFHYNVFKNKYGDKTEKLLTETDSLMYKTEIENIYESLNKVKKLFGFSNYSKDSKYYSGTNNLVVGKKKDKTSDMSIKDFVRL